MKSKIILSILVIILFLLPIVYAQEAITPPPISEGEISPAPCNMDEDCECPSSTYLKLSLGYCATGEYCTVSCNSLCNEDNICQMEVKCVPILSSSQIDTNITNYILNNISATYYSAHYEIVDHDLHDDGIMRINFEYTTDMGEKVNMSVTYDSCSDKIIDDRNILLEEHTITIDQESAEDIANANGLIEPYTSIISYSWKHKTSVWAISREYDPMVYTPPISSLTSLIIDARNGTVLEEFHYEPSQVGAGIEVGYWTPEVILFYGAIIAIILIILFVIYSKVKRK